MASVQRTPACHWKKNEVPDDVVRGSFRNIEFLLRIDAIDLPITTNVKKMKEN